MADLKQLCIQSRNTLQLFSTIEHQRKNGRVEQQNSFLGKQI